METYKYDLNKAKIDTPRTLFRIPHNYKTTLNAGDLIPTFCEETLPGDTWSIDISAVIRELTLLNPVMDNSYIQFDAFFCPMRLTWNHTKQFFGENDTGVWTQTNDYLIPSDHLNISTNKNTLSVGSLGDYFGLPIVEPDSNTATFSYLPLRGYALIWNYYYLCEATQAPVIFSKDDNVEFDTRLGSGYASLPLKVNRFGDLFTTALPQPQKGENVPFLNDYLPVVSVDSINLPDGTKSPLDVDIKGPMRWSNVNGNSYINGSTRLSSSNVIINTSGTEVVPANLYATTIGSTLKSINDLRIAFATQQYEETLARIGSRYNEYIYGMFGVVSPSEIINVPQYLGSVKKLINVNQVVATADNANAILGTTGAFSNTAISNEKLCIGSMTEHGYIYILAHVRTDNSYSQGVPKLFTKKSKFDIYSPLFANIGNVPIKNHEIFFSDDPSSDDEVFGYAEAWYEYKNKPNLSTGYMRPSSDQAFSSWTYGRIFENTPVLNSEFTEQTAEEVDRTIAVQSSISNQFKLDLFVDAKVSRIMPLYSIPGLKRI